MTAIGDNGTGADRTRAGACTTDRGRNMAFASSGFTDTWGCDSDHTTNGPNRVAAVQMLNCGAMTREWLVRLFEFSVVRWAAAAAFFCRANLYMLLGKRYQAIIDYCWIVRV